METIKVICSRNHCARYVHARGLCEMHYRRLVRKNRVGSDLPEREQRRFVLGTDEERFLSKVNQQNCWLWTGAKTTAGYGEFQVNGVTVYAHRWSYEHFVGQIPQELHIDHICFVRECVNPEHLEPVTIVENNRRAWARKPVRVVGL